MNHDPHDNQPFWVIATLLGVISLAVCAQTAMQLLMMLGAMRG